MSGFTIYTATRVAKNHRKSCVLIPVFITVDNYLSNKPVYIAYTLTNSSLQYQADVSNRMFYAVVCLCSGADEGPVLVVVFAAFVLGLFLMGGLWCIYTQTGTTLTQNDCLTFFYMISGY